MSIRIFLTLTVIAMTAGHLPAKENTTIIADYGTDQKVARITAGPGVTVNRTAGGQLRVRIAPFTEHGNQWPSINIGSEYFGKPVNLASYSRIELSLHHQTGGMSRVDFNICSNPDPSRGVDYEYALIPGNNAAVVRIDLNDLKSNDASHLEVFQVLFRPRATETIYLIDPIRAVFDPEAGSPQIRLTGGMQTLRSQFQTIKAASIDRSRADIQETEQALRKLEGEIASGRKNQFANAYRTLSRQLDDMVRKVARLRFADHGNLIVWEPDRYAAVEPATGPGLEAKLVDTVHLDMAGNEFRDVVISLTALDDALSLTVIIESKNRQSLPEGMVSVREAVYPKNPRGEYTNDALLPFDGALDIPAGETRQLWIRFNTRTIDVPVGEYPFNITFSDVDAAIQQTIDGLLNVWDFRLPSYDILPNHSYAIFHGGLPNDPKGEKYQVAVREMKLYGLNYLNFEPNDLPRPVGLDDEWQITGYDDAAYVSRLKSAIDAWNAAPGDERLHFIVSLSGFETLKLEKEGYAYLNDKWEDIFGQYIRHLAGLMDDAGLSREQWIIIIRDESGEPDVMAWDIPVAEAIKRIDPTIRTLCNSSVMLSDPQWAERYFAAFDVFQPHRGHDVVIDFLRSSGKTIWLYECHTDLAALGRNLYDYYRVYTWDMIERGITGTGVWTYYSSPHDRAWNEDFQGCQLIFLHPEAGIVHSRRYELFREGLDDYRYVAALRDAARADGDEQSAQAEQMIGTAAADITANRKDSARCEKWRRQMAEQILIYKNN